MYTLYAFKCVMVMCAWIWLVDWHFAAILVPYGTIKFSLSLSLS